MLDTTTKAKSIIENRYVCVEKFIYDDEVKVGVKKYKFVIDSDGNFYLQLGGRRRQNYKVSNPMELWSALSNKSFVIIYFYNQDVKPIILEKYGITHPFYDYD